MDTQGDQATTVRRPFDAVSLLTIFLVTLLCIQSRYVIGPLGGAGSPAQLVALCALGWWAFYHVQRVGPAPRTGPQPVRIALFVFFLAFMFAYAVAMARPIDGVESSSANLGMIGLLGWLGVALLAHDGIQDSERLETMLHRVVIGAALLGLLGVLQFVFQDELIAAIKIPGLRTNLPLFGLSVRSGFVRPAGTALHPIEFGAVLTLILPIAIARARSATTGRRLGPALCVFAIGLGIVVCGSRSAILSSMVGLGVLAAVWSARTRLFAGVAVGVLLVFVAATMPGVTGNLVKLFTGFAADGSVKSRTGSYTIVGEFFQKSPLFGRGFSTFLPSYRILDNQYLLLLVEVGLLGLLAFIGLLACAIGSAVATRKRTTNPAMAEQTQALAAGVAAAAVGCGTYDGLSFPTATGMLFLTIGMAGAAWRLVRVEGLSEGVSAHRAGLPGATIGPPDDASAPGPGGSARQRQVVLHIAGPADGVPPRRPTSRPERAGKR